MADKRAKLASRKTKQNARDLTLEDVLAVGGDKDDFEMMKDVDISGDFVSNEEDASENINEKEVKEWSINLHYLFIFSTKCKFKQCKPCTC